MMLMNTPLQRLSAALPAIALALVTGCGDRQERPTSGQSNLPVAPVRTQVAEMKTQPLTEEVVGTVRAKVRATLEAKLSGRIVAMPVDLGQTVRAGALVASLDAAEVKARYEQAQASLDQAERDWKRADELVRQQAMTRAEYDAAEARRRVTKAALAEAQAMMSYIHVNAPFDGVVVKKRAEVGDLAAPGKPLIEMENPQLLQLEADVPEAIASHLQRSERLPVLVDALPQPLTGVVTEMAPAADPVSRTFQVKAALPATRGLMSGQFARLVVPVGESRAVRVPVAPEVQRGELEILFVVAGGHAQLRLVKTGKRSGGDIEIVSGLDGGETVVTEGAARLMDNQPVEVK